MINKRRDIISYTLLIAAGLIWGSQFIFNEIAVAALPPFVVASGRTVVAAIVLTIILPFCAEKVDKSISISRRSLYSRYFCLAMLEAIWPFAAAVWGQQYVSSSMTAILFGFIPFFVVAFALFFIPGERFNIMVLLSLALGFIGLCLLLLPQAQTTFGFHHLLAMLAILSAALSFSISIIIIQTLPPISPVRLTRNIFIIAAVPMVIVCLAIYPISIFKMSFAALLAVIVLGSLCSGLVYIIYIKMIARAGATFASLCNYLVPLFGSFLGVMVMGESLHFGSVIALLLIFSSLLVYRFA